MSMSRYIASHHINNLFHMVFVLLTISAFLFSRVNLVIHLKKVAQKRFFFHSDVTEEQHNFGFQQMPFE